MKSDVSVRPVEYANVLLRRRVRRHDPEGSLALLRRFSNLPSIRNGPFSRRRTTFRNREIILTMDNQETTFIHFNRSCNKRNNSLADCYATRPRDYETFNIYNIL